MKKDDERKRQKKVRKKKKKKKERTMSFLCQASYMREGLIHLSAAD